jgi:hypothetical protein
MDELFDSRSRMSFTTNQSRALNRPHKFAAGLAEGVRRPWTTRLCGAKVVKRTMLAGLACVLTLIVLFPSRVCAQLQDERAVKAAFVFNLTKYVEWPQPSQNLTIGFVGEGPMGEILHKVLDGKASDSRPIHVLLSPSDEQMEQCNILYIAYVEPKKIRAILDKVRTKNVLTVGETELFVQDSGMVALVRSGDHVQILVNLESTQNSHLKISSRLLNLSTIVRSAPGARD